jgi:outer membrane lipoprotein-sorting protein
MSLFARNDTVKFYFDEGKLNESAVSEEFIEVKEKLPYKLRREYQKKMASSIIYKGNNEAQIKPDAVEHDKWLLAKIIVRIVAEDENGDIEELEDKAVTPQLIDELDSKIIDQLSNKIKDMYGLTAQAKEEADELGE